MQITHLTTNELAERLKVKPMTLYSWRRDGSGPPFIKIGSRKILYRIEDVERWEQDRLRRNTAEDMK